MLQLYYLCINYVILVCLMILSISFLVPTCPPLTTPDNGDIDCSLVNDGEANTGDTCTFTCDDNHEFLQGSSTRTCQDDGTWSGTEAMCSRGSYICMYGDIIRA